MNRRTYEILARWIAKESKVQIEFGDKGPAASVKEKRIYLPYNIKDSNVFAALAWLMHEAQHINMSQFPDEFNKEPVAHDILNAIEDVRIDEVNFQELPNIRDFYERMFKDHILNKEGEENFKKADLPQRILINTIMEMENFGPHKDQESLDAMWKLKIPDDFREAHLHLYSKNWKKLKEVIQRIMNKLGLKEQPQQGGQGDIIIIEGGQGDKDINGQNGKGDGKPGNKPGELGGSIRITGLDLEKYLHPSSMWGKGHLEGASSADVGTAALKDNTKEHLKELLNIKETKIIQDGIKLDTDNLISLFTGEIENLFNDEDIVKKRKSKIMFLLDASGSMSSDLLDNQSRRKVLVKCVKAMTEILDEIRQTEGLDVSYEVNAFNNQFLPLKQENWAEDYSRYGGGTNIIESFKRVQQEMIADGTIDGKKLVIVLTDGDVSENEIEEVRKEIIRNNQDVRCMFIGIGAEILGAYNQQILGDNNILMEEMADQIIMEVICTML
jgi:hypothetical protein